MDENEHGYDVIWYIADAKKWQKTRNSVCAVHRLIYPTEPGSELSISPNQNAANPPNPADEFLFLQSQRGQTL